MTQLLDKFRELPDYRKCKQLKFNVGEILFMSLLATLSGANGYGDKDLSEVEKNYLKTMLNNDKNVESQNEIIELIKYAPEPMLSKIQKSLEEIRDITQKF